MSPRAPATCPPSGEKSFLGPQGWGRAEGSGRNTHSLWEVRLCHLTLEGRKNRIQFLVCSSVARSPNPAESHVISAQRIFGPGRISVDLPLSPAKVSGVDQAWLSHRRLLGQGRVGCGMTPGPAPAYLTIRSCGVAPCRPCLPSGRPSLDPSGTGGEAQGVSGPQALRAPLTGSHAQLPTSCALGRPPSGTRRWPTPPEAGAGASPWPLDLGRAGGILFMHQIRKQTQRGKDTGPRLRSAAPGQLSNHVSWTP